MDDPHCKIGKVTWKAGQEPQTAEIITLPGVERRDLLEDVPAERVLSAAIEDLVRDVVVIGRDRAGRFYIASEIGDADKVVGLLMRAINELSSVFITGH